MLTLIQKKKKKNRNENGNRFFRIVNKEHAYGCDEKYNKRRRVQVKEKLRNEHGESFEEKVEMYSL